MQNETSVRVRVFFIVGPALAIAWSAYAAFSTAEARSRASDAEQSWRVQCARVDGARRVWARLRRDGMLAGGVARGPGLTRVARPPAQLARIGEGVAETVGHRGLSVGGALTVGGAGAPRASSAVIGAATVGAAAVGETESAPEALSRAARAEATGVDPETLASDAAAASVAQAASAPPANAAGASSPANAGAAVANAAPAAAAQPMASATVAANTPAIISMPSANTALPAAPANAGWASASAAAAGVAGVTAAREVALRVTGESTMNAGAGSPAVMVDPLVAAKAAAAERAKMVTSLRERIGALNVQVDEIRLSGIHEEGTESVRTLRAQLSGKRDAVKKAVALLKEDPQLRDLKETKAEGSSRRGDYHAAIVATVEDTASASANANAASTASPEAAASPSAEAAASAPASEAKAEEKAPETKAEATGTEAAAEPAEAPAPKKRRKRNRKPKVEAPVEESETAAAPAAEPEAAAATESADVSPEANVDVTEPSPDMPADHI